MHERKQQETFEPVALGHVRSHGYHDLVVHAAG
jgi:hypothetical protein